MTNPNTGAASSTTATTLSDQELRAVAYFAMGVGSEIAIGTGNVAQKGDLPPILSIRL
jgi:hypothetical protein